MSSDENQRYTAIIDDILSTADLETISRKKVRQGLENALGGKDLSEQKASKQKTWRVNQACPSSKTNLPGVCSRMPSRS